MKKALKIVLPIVILLGIVGGAYWYFIRYNPLLTADLLTDLGDTMISRDHPRFARQCYEWASGLSPRSGSLAGKLADAYQAEGNYTRVEQTLVRAIRANPDNPDLYRRLSAVFVAQDKLLDAQTMLDNISSDTAAAAIAADRPEPPTISPEGNYYTDYITVEISGSRKDATYCYTTDGTFPSAVKNPYREPFQLEGGETTVCAVAIAPNGLVSHAAYMGYTVAGVVEEVRMADSALEEYVRLTKNIGSRAVRTDDLWSFTELELPEGVQSAEDLSLFTGLRSLSIRDKGEMDYSALPRLYSLRRLEFDHCSLGSEDLELIAQCPNLEELVLCNCSLSNVTPLRELTGLRLLDLSDNSIGSIDALADLTALEELYLGHNALTGLPDLSAIPGLKMLDLSYNALTDVSGLRACSSLLRLNLSHNRLTSVDPVGNLTSLVFFNGSNNPVEDLSALASCTKLETFIMQDCKFTEIDFIADITSIQEINIEYNDVVSLPQFNKESHLTVFNGSHCRLEDISGLAGLPNLTAVNANVNNIRDISCLQTCPVLARICVEGTYIRSPGVFLEKVQKGEMEVKFTPSAY